MIEEKKISSNLQQFLENFDELKFLKLFRCFRMAISPNKMMLSFMTILLLTITGVIMDLCSSNVVRAEYKKAVGYYNSGLYEHIPDEITELDVYIAKPKRYDTFINRFEEEANPRGVFSTMASFTAKKFNSFVISLVNLDLRKTTKAAADFLSSLGWALRHHTIYSFIYIAIASLIIGLFGGAICRAAAMEFAIHDKPGPIAALKFSKSKLSSFAFAPVAPFILILFFGGIIFGLGLLANLPWVGEILLGLLMIITLVLGIVIAITFFGAVGGLILSLPAISFEASNSYDAFSRSFCYSFSKPWKLIFYTAVSAVYGSICYLFVRFFAFLILKSSYVFLETGMFTESAKSQGIDKLTAIWPEPEFFNFLGTSMGINFGWSEKISFLLVNLAVMVIAGAVASFVLSYFYSSSVVIYSLMRNVVDKIPTNELYIKIHHIEETPEDVVQTMVCDKVEPQRVGDESSETEPIEPSGDIESSEPPTSADEQPESDVKPEADEDEENKDINQADSEK